MPEDYTPEHKYHQTKDIASDTPDSPLDVLSSILKPQAGKDYILPILICIITIVHFLAFPHWDSFWIDIIRLSLSILTIFYITNIARKAYNKRLAIIKSFNNSQPQFFTTIVAFGGMLAIFIPMIMNIAKLIDNSALLTTALLTITGGIIAIFGYYITHQKSELEKEQMNMQKQKDARDHIRQLHDSYNDRFDKAVAELNSSNVRAAYAAVPKLAKLADAWLDYKDLSNDKEELKKLKKKAKKEAQTIINILCKYVRTMPGEYTEENLKNIGALNFTDQDTLKNESEVRRLIFSEMSDRFSKVTFENENLTTTPGIWSKFNFDFTRAPIFYPLNNLKIEKGVFTSAKFYSNADFRGSTFIKDVDFNEVTFNGKADFSSQGEAKTIFGGDATFNGTHFSQEAKFTEVTFNESADFSAQSDIKTVFGAQATFNDVQFHKEISFNKVLFEGIADFSTKKIESFNETFMSDAKFTNTHFKKTANFSYIHSYSNNNSHKIYFKQVDFHEDSLFINTEFQTDVHFEKTVFHRKAKFNDAIFLKSVEFYNKTNFQGEAIFSGLAVWMNTKFKNVSFDDKSYFKGAILGSSTSINQQETCFYESRFDEDADFSDVHFCGINKFIDLYFFKEVSFYNSTFTGDTSFIQNPNNSFALNKITSPKYKEKAEFSDAKFEGKLHFENIEFNDGADFIRTVFYEESNFENILFKNSSPDFKDAKFTVHSSHRFTTSQNSIPCRRKKLRDPRNNKLKAYKIPIGSYLFDNDPDNPIAGPA